MKWNTWIFDCDGVLLNSNGVKREAMYRSALGYGSEKAKLLEEYHVNNGGIGREVKFRWFLQEIVGVNRNLEKLVADLKHKYRENLWDGLMTCEVTPGIFDILARLKKEGASLFVVSGADQDELREILTERELAPWFDGIYGAPDTKDQILAREINAKIINRPAIFLGDSQYDYEASKRANLDFFFIHEWTDVANWKEFVEIESIVSKAHVADALAASI